MPNNPNYPQPPADLEGEQLIEWERVVAEMDAAGTLAPKCRALLTLYVQAWSIVQATNKYVVAYGPVVKCSGQIRASQFYKTWREAVTTCNSLLVNLGLTVTKLPTEKKEAEELEI